MDTPEKLDTPEAERLLGLLADAVESTGDFVVEQAPDIVQQMVLYGRCMYTAGVVLGACLLVVACCMWWSAWKRSKGGAILDDAHIGAFVTALGGVIPAMVGCLTIGATFGPCLMTWVAPKLYVMNELMELAN